MVLEIKKTLDKDKTEDRNKDEERKEMKVKTHICEREKDKIRI